MSAGAPRAEAASFGRFAILAAERRLLVDGTPVALGSRAFDLLAALVARRDRVVPKEELIEVVWPGLVVEDNNLQVQISALRKVLGSDAIATVPGRGYQFTVALAATAPSSGERRSAGSAAPMRGSRLLVADDNKVNRLLLCRSLQLMGHTVASAQDGRAALEALRGGGVDLLLLDLEMPELDGFALLEQRAADPSLREVPVIVTSSVEGVAAVARCIELGADDFLHKPVNPVLLKARVEASLERKHLRDRERELLARLAPAGAGTAAGPDSAVSRRAAATLLVARLQGFDAPGMALPAQEALDLLGSWTTLMLDAVESRGGIVLQLAGDAIGAAFGAHVPASPADAAAAAVQAALEMRELTAGLDAERVASRKAPLALGIGIAGGEVVAGYAATSRRSAFVCVGAAVERAERLAGLAPATGGVLLDDTAHADLAGRVPTETLAPALLPGRSTTVPVHALKPA
jgi:DNA-binding response OmpR family regulator